jgi:hypothetical protein
MKRSEKEVKELLGSRINNTMNHFMKDKDTTNTCFPTSGLWNGESIFKTTNKIMEPIAYSDPDLNKRHHIQMNPYKHWDEEMQKSKNMIKSSQKTTQKKEVKNKK